MLVPRLHWIRVEESPWLTVEAMVWMSAMPETASSTGRVTWVFSSDGAAPDWVTSTMTTGNSTLG